MRKLLLSIAALTLTFAPSALAGVGPIAAKSETQTYDLALPPITFGDLQFDGKGAVLVPVTVTNEDEVTIPTFDVAFSRSIADWALQTPLVSVPELAPTGEKGAAFSTVLGLQAPADLKPGSSLLVSAKSGNLAASQTYTIPAVALTPIRFATSKRKNYTSLRFDAIVTVPGRTKKFECTTKTLSPSVSIRLQNKASSKAKELVSGALAGDALKVKGGKCVISFEYPFERKYDGKFASLVFKFKSNIGGGKRTVSTSTATAEQKLTPGAPIKPLTTVKKIG